MAELPPEIWSRIVRIEGRQGPLGTGFRLSARRVLTGYHVVQGHEEFWVLDPHPESEEEWLGSSGSAAETRILWRPDGDARAPTALDAALLETPPAEGVEPFTRFQEWPVERSVEWRTYAFPEAMGLPENRQPIQGDTAGFKANQGRFALEVSQAPAVSGEGWKGVSGAPIFARTGADWFLLAVLRGTWEDFANSRFQAVSLPALLKVESFRNELDLPKQDPREKQLRDQAAACLGRPDVADEVAQEHDPWAEEWAEWRDASRLVGLICLKTSPEVMAARLADAVCRLMREGKRRAAQDVADLLLIALGLCHLKGLPAKSETNVERDVATPQKAAIYSAAMDGRPLSMAAPSGPEQELPLPELLVEKPPEGGLDLDGEQAASDVGKHLVETLALSGGGSGSRHSDPERRTAELIYLAICNWAVDGRWGPLPRNYREIVKGSDVASNRATVAKLVNQWLRREAERVGRYFVVLDEPADGRLNETLSRQLSELRRFRRRLSPQERQDLLVQEYAVLNELGRVFHCLRQGTSQESNEEPT